MLASALFVKVLSALFQVLICACGLVLIARLLVYFAGLEVCLVCGVG